MLLGTCLGSGMLALPLAAAKYNYATNFFYLLLSWALMTTGAFAILEVHLWMPSGSNLFTMSQRTLGKYGNIFALITYLLLLYALISAYIAASADLFHGFVYVNYGINFLPWQSALIVFTLLFIIIAFGIRIIDLTNRLLMFVKLSAFVVMLSLMLAHVDYNLLTTGSSHHYPISTFMVMNTAFGFAIILPSLRSYLEDNHKNLTMTLIIGCFIPLLLYTLWVLAVQGLLPKDSENGLIRIANSTNPNSNLIQAIASYSGLSLLITFSKIFISISAITSFLGVGLCLVDFIRDIINNIYTIYFIYPSNTDKLSAKIIKNFIIYALSFVIPLFVVLYNPGIFIKALSYAGILVLIFLVLLPLVMIYVGRYKLNYIGKKYLPFGKLAIIFLICSTIILLAYSVNTMII